MGTGERLFAIGLDAGALIADEMLAGPAQHRGHPAVHRPGDRSGLGRRPRPDPPARPADLTERVHRPAAPGSFLISCKSHNSPGNALADCREDPGPPIVLDRGGPG